MKLFRSAVVIAALPVALFATSTMAFAQLSPVTRDDFTGGFNSSLAWSTLVPKGGGGTTGITNAADYNFSTGTTLSMSTAGSGSLYGVNNNPTNFWNLTVTSVPTSWYLETSIKTNYADMTNYGSYTQSDLVVARDSDFFYDSNYNNNADSAAPATATGVSVSSNSQTTSTPDNSGYGGVGSTTTNYSGNNIDALMVKVRIESKATGTPSNFVSALGGTSTGIFEGVSYSTDGGATWSAYTTYGTLNASSTGTAAVSYAVLSGMAAGYHVGLAVGSAPTSGTIPVANFDYIETNLGIQGTSGPEPISIALLLAIGGPALCASRLRRRA